VKDVNLTEDTLNHMPAIVRIAGEYKITIMELLGPSKQEKLVAARTALCRLLHGAGVPIATVARVVGRDRSSVRNLLERRVNPTPAFFERREVADPPPREHTAQRYKHACKRGSKALADAIFASGKTHGPMSEKQQIDALIWCRDGLKNLHATGWMV
jgi:hypothetical protein